MTAQVVLAQLLAAISFLWTLISGALLICAPGKSRNLGKRVMHRNVKLSWNMALKPKMKRIFLAPFTSNSDCKLCELMENPNVQSRATVSQAVKTEGATTIPKGSRGQATPKRRESLWDCEIVFSEWTTFSSSVKSGAGVAILFESKASGVVADLS